MGLFQRTKVDRRSFCSLVRFQGFFNNDQRVFLKVTFSLPVSRRTSLRRSSSTGFLQVFHDMKAGEQNLSSMFAYHIHIGGPHVHAYHLQRVTAPFPQFLGEELLYRFFRAIFAHPQKYAPLQIVDHSQINLAFTSAHLIDADPVYGRPFTLAQAISHRPLYNPGHRLPVQRKMPRRAAPTQFSGQTSRGIGQSSSHSRPRLGPREILHPHPTPPALHPTRLVTQNQMQLSHRQVPSLPPLPDAVHASAWTPTNSTSPLSPAKPIDLDDHDFSPDGLSSARIQTSALITLLG